MTLLEQAFAAASTVMSDGQAMVGFSVSWTSTVKLQLPVLPEASVAEQFTVVVPEGNVEPDGGTQVAVRVPEQLSVAEAEKFTTAEHPCVTMFAGQVTTGFVVSATMIFAEQDALAPLSSVTVKVTLLVPSA